MLKTIETKSLKAREMKFKIKTLNLAAFLFFVVSVGCTRTLYQPVQIEKVQTDSISQKSDTAMEQFHSLLNELRQSVNVRDSVVIRDSVIMVVNDAGDVISKETFHDRDHNYSKDESIFQLQEKYDSIFNAQREEFNAILNRLEQTPVVMERKLSQWELVKQEIGGVAIGLLVAVIVIAVVWLIKKIKRK